MRVDPCPANGRYLRGAAGRSTRERRFWLLFPLLEKVTRTPSPLSATQEQSAKECETVIRKLLLVPMEGINTASPNLIHYTESN